MQAFCPSCKLNVRMHKTRWLPASLSLDKAAIAQTVLHKYGCKRCRVEWLIRIDRHEDTTLADTVSYPQGMALWNEAMTQKPGVDRLGSTASEYTKLIGRATHVVYSQILNRAA